MHTSFLPDDLHDRVLLQNVHPAGWQNPEPAGRYHLVVLGGGTAGLVAAAGAAGLGARVALVEKNNLGGDCLNFGCVPSKALLRSARAVEDVRRAGALGVRVPEGTSVDFAAVMERLRRLRAGVSKHDSAERFRALGVDVFLGAACFTGPDVLRVQEKTLQFKRALIATGARPVLPEVPGLREAGCLTNETIFAMTALPQRLAVIGAGPMGCELAQAFARFGSRVILVHAHAQVLPREDADAAHIVESALQRDRVQLVMPAKLRKVIPSSSGPVLEVDVEGKLEHFEVDAILAAAGRQPNIEGLGLEPAGVKFNSAGVILDDRLRTSNRRIYAAGDVSSRFKFTHAADAEARLVIRNALFPGKTRASSLVVPWCTYTDPEIAHVGISEHEAAQGKLAIQTFRQPLCEVDRAILDGEEEGFVKIHVRMGTDQILGATIVARHAGDMIAEVGLAMTEGLGLRSLSRSIHPYPTQAEAVRKTADAWQRSRLTERVKWWLRQWFRWT